MSMAVLQDSTPLPASRSRPFSSPLALSCAVYLAALAWTFVVRLPTLRADSGDDAVYIWIAHQWMRGVPPYSSVFDVKPPGIFALLGLSELAFGTTLSAVRALTIAADAATATGLFFLARRFGSSQVGAFAASLYPILSALIIAYDAVSALAALTVLAFLAATSSLPPIRRAALAGLMIGAAGTVKQTAALEAVALAWIVTSASEAAGRRVRTALAFAAGAAVAPLGFLIVFALQGVARPLIEDILVASLLRPGSHAEGVSFIAGLQRFLPLQRGALPLTALCVSAVMRRRKFQESAPDLPLSALFAWLAAALSGVILQRSLYEQYLSPALGPALLIAGFCADRALTELRRVPPAARLLGLGALILGCALRAPTIDYLHVPGPEYAALQTAADAIRGADPQPSDRLYVVNRGLWLNSMLDMAPPGEYVFPIHTLCHFDSGGVGAGESNLAARPRYVVVADPRNRAACEQPEPWRLIQEALAHDYRKLVHAAGAHDGYDVYERIDPQPFAGWSLRP